MTGEPESARNEEARVQEVFRRRDALGLDAVHWSPFRPEAFYLDGEIQRALLRAFKQLGIGPQGAAAPKILEVGCGRGRWLRWLLECGFRDVIGADLLPGHLHDGRRLSPEAVRWVRAEAALLPFGDGVFDAAIQSRTFSCILDAGMRARAARELLRVVKPEGAVLWVDQRREPWHRCYPQGAGAYQHHFTRDEVDGLFPHTTKRWIRFGLNPLLTGALTSLANRGWIRSLLHRVPGIRRRIAWPDIPMIRFPYVTVEVLNALGLGTVYDLAVIRKNA